MEEKNQAEAERIIEENKSVEESLHSEDMQDIIGAPPKWLYKWGITIILAVLCFCISMSFFISYPDVIHVNLRVKSLAPFTTVTSLDTAVLSQIHVNNDDFVRKGQILATLNVSGINKNLKAPVNGRLIYAGIIHDKNLIIPKQPVFYIATDNSNFYGEIIIAPNYLQKIRPGQQVLVSFRDLSKDEYINGVVKYVTEDTSKNSQHVAQIDFKQINTKSAWLKDGITADAGILTSKSTIFDRLVRSVLNRL